MLCLESGRLSSVQHFPCWLIRWKPTPLTSRSRGHRCKNIGLPALFKVDNLVLIFVFSTARQSLTVLKKNCGHDFFGFQKQTPSWEFLLKKQRLFSHCLNVADSHLMFGAFTGTAVAEDPLKIDHHRAGDDL